MTHRTERLRVLLQDIRYQNAIGNVANVDARTKEALEVLNEKPPRNDVPAYILILVILTVVIFA